MADLEQNYMYSPINEKQNNKNDCLQEYLPEYSNAVPVIGKRHLQIGLYFILGFVAFAFRVTMAVAIVAMTDPSVNNNPDIPIYPGWTKKNFILSAFFWGYVALQLVAAWAAKKYSAKWLLVVVIFIQSVLGILTPLTAALLGEKGIMLSRAIEGLCQGFVFPVGTHLISQWVPPQERSRYGSVMHASGKLGTLFAMAITGYISASSYGWPWAFRLMGILGLIWCVLMAIFGYDSPGRHPTISQVERLYIERSLGTDCKKHTIPWKAIFTSAPVWALFIAQSGQIYCFWTLLTQIPSYMNYVLKFDIKHNGVWSSMPYLTMFILSYTVGFISDGIINRGVVSRVTARKIFNSIGFLVPAIALVTLGFINANQKTEAIALLIIAVGVSSASFSGFAINHMDLSPNHAGVLVGLINGTGQIGGILAPLVVQMLVTNQADILQWRYVFIIAAGIYVVTALAFIIFGSAKVQWWNKEENETKE